MMLRAGQRARWIAAALGVAVSLPAAWGAEEPGAGTPSPEAANALQLLESRDAYERQLGFLRLEALREPSTVEAVRGYLDHRNPEVRAYSLRAVAAIEGPTSVPTLLHALQHDRHHRVRRAALLGLEPFYPDAPLDILPAMIAALRDRNTQVRMAAVDIVSRVDDPDARAAILERHERERDRDVRRVLNTAVTRLDAS